MDLQPNAGGCCEWLIGIIKGLLMKTLCDIYRRVETLQSVLIEAENILNARPLTEIPLTNEAEEPLTPNHFAQALKDRLWKRLIVEYLSQLMCRTKWYHKTTPFQVDDLVLVMDATAPRSTWKKGRVIEVFFGKDQQVRSADVKTEDNLLRRPTSKLIKLQLSGES